jgi:hypothetical protein
MPEDRMNAGVSTYHSSCLFEYKICRGFTVDIIFESRDKNTKYGKLSKLGGWMKLAYLNGTGLREGSPAHDPIIEKDFIAGRGLKKRDSEIVRNRNV